MERCSRDAMDPNLRHKPRLISEEELPSWLLKGEEEVSLLHHCWRVEDLLLEAFTNLNLYVSPEFLLNSNLSLSKCLMFVKSVGIIR